MGLDSNSDVLDIDVTDRTIIDLLQEDGRRSNASIARAVGVSESTVKNRIDRLVKRGVMRVIAVVDPTAAGLGQHIFVGINVKPGTVFIVGDALAEMDEVVFLGYVTGRYDLMVEVLARDSDELLQFLSKRLADVDGIASLETFVMLRAQKITYYNWRLPEGPAASEAGSDGEGRS